jgi:hypothetical protein
MADRETKLFITPNSHQVLLHTYLTGREASALKSILLSSLKMTMSDMESKKVDMGGISGETLAEQERKTLEFLIVSVDGSAENAVEKFLDLPSSEYDAVLKEIENIKNPTTPEN